jgi:hypothetical protein
LSGPNRPQEYEYEGKNYFTNSYDFPKCDPPCKLEDINPLSLRKLNHLRFLFFKMFKKPLYLNCAFRSIAHDKAAGRSGRGAHPMGRAFDVRSLGWTSSERAQFVRLAWEVGFTRIGIYKNFVHIDDRVDMNPPHMLWHG